MRDFTAPKKSGSLVRYRASHDKKITNTFNPLAMAATPQDMMKRTSLSITAIATALAFASAAAQAESWNVTITYSYINTHKVLLENLPAESFTVPLDDCAKGASRTTRMIPRPMKSTQSMCVNQEPAGGSQRHFRGWAFAERPVTDEIFQSEIGQLNWGTPLDFTTDGSEISFSTGVYHVHAKRNAD